MHPLFSLQSGLLTRLEDLGLKLSDLEKLLPLGTGLSLTLCACKALSRLPYGYEVTRPDT